MRRITAIILAILLLLSGCSLIERISDAPSVTPPTAYTAEYASNWAYACLSSDQQLNYGAIYTAVREGFATDAAVTLDASDVTYNGIRVELPNPVGTEDEIRELYQAFMQDNPVFFYIGNAYGYHGVTVGGDRLYDTLILTYTMTASERAAAQMTFFRERDAMLGLLDSSMTAFEKELTLHDALLDRCRYHDAAAADTRNPAYRQAFTAYGALVEGNAVCEGYAYAMQYLLTQAGIPATVVIGYDAEDGEPHMWNAVLLDGKPYYLDPTWNDGASPLTYTFFNVTTDEVLKSHRLGDETIGIPTAVETEHNYYRMTGSYLDTMDQKKIAEHVAALLASNREIIHLRFAPTVFDNAFFFVKNAAWFTETVNACLPVGVPPLYAYELLYDENYNTVTICKKTS